MSPERICGGGVDGGGGLELGGVGERVGAEGEEAKGRHWRRDWLGFRVRGGGGGEKERGEGRRRRRKMARGPRASVHASYVYERN